jgi:hypothetical protein
VLDFGDSGDGPISLLTKPIKHVVPVCHVVATFRVLVRMPVALVAKEIYDFRATLVVANHVSFKNIGCL